MLRRSLPSILRQAYLARSSGNMPRRAYKSRPLWPPLGDMVRTGPWGLFHHPDRWFKHHLQESNKLMNWMMNEMNNPGVWSGPLYRGPLNNAQRVDVEYNKKTFQITVDVSDFAPEDISLKVVDDRIILAAKQQETSDEHGYYSHQMSRSFLIPQDVDPESVQSHLTTDHKLVISGKVEGSENVKERVINIEKKD